MLHIYLMRNPFTLLLGVCFLTAPCFSPLACAQKRNKQPLPVFLPGHYWLADGIRREGHLCLLSDNELLVKSADTARSKSYAAVHVRNFVIATDSFTVLRNIDVNVNDVITRYPSAMVQVIRPIQAVPFYRLRGPMEVYAQPVNPNALAVLRGISGGAVGIAGGMLADEISSNSPKRFKEQVLTLCVFRTTPTSSFEALQPLTVSAHNRLLALVAGNAPLAKRLRKQFVYSLTENSIMEMVSVYLGASANASH